MGRMAVDLGRLRNLAEQVRATGQRSRERRYCDISVSRVSSSGILDFDPNQPRNPHTGEWGFADGAWVASVLHFAAGAMQVGAGDDDRVTLGFDLPDGGGRANTSLSNSDALARMLRGADGMPVGRSKNVAEYEGQRYATRYVGFTRTGEDTFELDLSSGDGSAPPETAGLFDLTTAETTALADEVERVSAARRVTTDRGKFTTVLERDGQLSTSFPATGGNRLDLTMTPDNGNAVYEAIHEAVVRIDEFPQDDHGNPLLGPDDMVTQITVPLAGTDLIVSSFGQYENGGYLRFESSRHDWYLQLPATEAEDIGSAFEWSAGLAIAIEENRGK